MSGRWDTPGVPHKGWVCVDVTDVCNDDDHPDDRVYETCEMCGNEKIRYVHAMEHKEYPGGLNVGCICAEKMSEDYIGPRQRERDLKNIARKKRREKVVRHKKLIQWIDLPWRRSARGNEFKKMAGVIVTIFHHEAGAKSGWKYVVNGNFSGVYGSNIEAKVAAFNIMGSGCLDRLK